MSNSNCLPVILVSAKTAEAASKLISEIIDDEAWTGEGLKENEEREWVIDNKYYRAVVAFRALGDDVGDAGDVADLNAAEAHLVLLQPGEAVADAERRRARLPRPELALLAVDAERVPAALDAWALAARIEPVELRPRRAATPERAEPFACETGVRRLREALHAHVWPGLRRHRAPAAAAAARAEDASAEEELERFAAAAAALDAAARLPAAERRARADHLILTLSRALRIPLDDL